MNTFLKHYGRVAWLMAGIVALSAVVTAFTGSVGLPRRERAVVTTTYPLYVAVQHILGDTKALTVENLTGSAVGCLHDYQLSPANRIALQNASLVLLNGGGAESFLADALATTPALPTVDTSVGVEWLSSCHENDHSHDAPTSAHKEEVNEHIWVSPARYAAQVKAATDAICALDPDRAAIYAANGAAYQENIRAAGTRLRTAADKLSSKTCILFHDSLAYLADDLGFSVAATLHVGEESGVSAADLSAAQQVLKENPNALLLYDSQYTIRYPALDALVPADHVMAMNTAVIGHGRASDWLDAMAQNAQMLERITEGTV